MKELRIFNQKYHKEKRRHLRNNATPAERKLWSELRRSQLDGIKFRRQQGIGPYIVDFYCPKFKLVIELDGESHNSIDAKEYDTERTQFLSLFNLKVIRFSNDEVYKNMDAVIQKILKEIHSFVPTTPQSPPQRGGDVS